MSIQEVSVIKCTQTLVASWPTFMGPLQDLLVSLADDLDPNILYEDILRDGGFYSLPSIGEADSAEQIVVACGLRFGEANVIWKAACAGNTGKQALTAYKAIQPQ